MVFINQTSLNNQQDDNYHLFNKSKNELNAHLGNKHSKERDDGLAYHNKRANIMNK